MRHLSSSNLITTNERSYLVRFWQNHAQGGWRASVQCVQTGNTLVFGTMDSLVAFLQTEVGYNSAEGTSETGEP